MGTVGVTVVEVWQSVVYGLVRLGGNYNLWRALFGVFGVLGASTMFGLVVDAFYFFFFHVFFIYLGIVRLWDAGLQAIRTTWQLFRGKKMNILKSRVDGHDYDLEQLLLGTVFFSIFAFLVPTIFVFFVTLTLIWLSIFLLQLVFFFLHRALVTIPVYQLFAPSRLSNGVFLTSLQSPLNSPQIFLKLNKQQTPLSAIFGTWLLLIGRSFPPLDLSGIVFGRAAFLLRYSAVTQRRSQAELEAAVKRAGDALFS
jgi:MFS family permease